jgi:hypothetical protein
MRLTLQCGFWTFPVIDIEPVTKSLYIARSEHTGYSADRTSLTNHVRNMTRPSGIEVDNVAGSKSRGPNKSKSTLVE